MDAREKVEQIIRFLSDRGGFDGWWGDIDSDTQDEIKNELAQILEN